MALNHLFLDFNAYFASCEQHMRPELRGRPIGVVATMAETGTCIAASYEAKAHGVSTGTLVREARLLCPGIVFVEARPSEYVRIHHELIKIVDRHMYVESVHSIDEVSCRLTGRWRESGVARKLALDIKAAIRSEVGPCIRCSVGIGPNRFIAKTASDMQKPDGLVIIDSADLPAALHPLELRDLCGIGQRMEARLRSFGICTVEQLAATSRARLRTAWGSVEGERYWMKLRGDDFEGEPTRRTVVGHSHVLPPELRSDARALPVMHRLLQKAAMRLRAMDYFTRELCVSVQYQDDAPTWETRAGFSPTQDTVELAAAMEKLWSGRPRQPRVKPMLVAVTLTGLEHSTDNTLALFPTPADRRFSLMRAVDELNIKYGNGAIYWAAAHEGRSAAPMRIAFSRIPDAKTETDPAMQMLRQRLAITSKQ